MKEIGYIETDFVEKFGVPRQSGLVEGIKGKIIFRPEYRTYDAFKGLEEFSYIWLIWGFSKIKKKNWSATVKPPRLGGNKRVGVFATRSPFRPNSIGLSSVKLEKVAQEKGLGTVLYVSGVDLVHGTPIYDIKPYLAYTDSHPQAKGGFSDLVKEHKLKVEIANSIIEKIPMEERENIIGILEQDPRPSYIEDEERIYGVTYGVYNIRFQVKINRLIVIDIENKKLTHGTDESI